jgi:hypothetical protein
MFETRGEVSALETARTALHSAERRVGVRHRSEALAPVSQQPDPLPGLLPGGVLPAGAAVVVSGSAGLLGWLLGATQRAAWLAVVGWPELGIVALVEAGVDLERVVTVPEVSGQAPAVLAALIGGVDLVVVGAGVRVAGAEQRRLLARARKHGTTILSPQAWQGAIVRLEVEDATRGGLDRGDGYLRQARLAVRRQSAADGAGRWFTVERDGNGTVAIKPAVRSVGVRASAG